MVSVCTAMGVLYVEHANVLELCYIELLSGDGSPYSILSGAILLQNIQINLGKAILALNFPELWWQKEKH